MTTETKGPWKWGGPYFALLGKGQKGVDFDDCILRCLGNCEPSEADAELIASAPALRTRLAEAEGLLRALIPAVPDDDALITDEDGCCTACGGEWPDPGHEESCPVLRTRAFLEGSPK